VSQDESDAILGKLYDIGERREYISSMSGSSAISWMWDNRCTIHARTDFPKEERRLLRRCNRRGRGPVYE